MDCLLRPDKMRASGQVVSGSKHILDQGAAATRYCFRRPFVHGAVHSVRAQTPWREAALLVL